MGKKRASDGKEKPSKPTQPSPSNKTPPCAQAPASSNTPSTTPHIPLQNPKKKKPNNPQRVPSHTKQPRHHQKRQKLPKLPQNATITKRPLHHPAIPTPFSSSTNPKTIYLTHSSPFVPTLKRIRHLLREVSKRDAQSQSQNPQARQQRRARRPLEPDGRLAAADVEREIAEEGRGKAGLGGEGVFVKAAGRAIERALRVGVYFQGEGDCRVRVEMGSVMAVDDVEVREVEGGEVEGRDGDGDGGEEEEVPETRVRMVSSVTVAIGLK